MGSKCEQLCSEEVAKWQPRVARGEAARRSRLPIGVVVWRLAAFVATGRGLSVDAMRSDAVFNVDDRRT